MHRLLRFLESLGLFRIGIREERDPFAVIRQREIAAGRRWRRYGRARRRLRAGNLTDGEMLLLAVFKIADDNLAISFGRRNPIGESVSVRRNHLHLDSLPRKDVAELDRLLRGIGRSQYRSEDK